MATACDVAVFERHRLVTKANFRIKVDCLFYCSALFVGWNWSRFANKNS